MSQIPLAPLIILEGPDGAGKTTLATALLQRLAHAGGQTSLYLHGTVMPNIFEHHLDLMSRAIKARSAGMTVVLDRHWISEYVYAPAMGRSTVVEYGLAGRSFHRHWLYHGATYVMCCPEPTRIVAEYDRAVAAGKSEYAERHQIEDIATRYVDLERGSLIRHHTSEYNYVDWIASRIAAGEHTDLGLTRSDPLRYDRYGPAGNNLVRTSDKILELARADASSLHPAVSAHPWGPITGSLRGLSSKTVLLGDASNGLEIAPPFLGQHHSSAYLNRALHRANVSERDVVIVNANDADPSLLEGIVGAARRVVPMGDNALNALSRLNAPFDKLGKVLKHPQWHSRFAHNRLDEYAAQLAEAIYGESP